MFDFEKLNVYREAKDLNRKISDFLKQNKSIDKYLRDQLKRASISVVINIAEGSGKFTKADKRNFYTIARGSVYECVALVDILSDENTIDDNMFEYFYQRFESISKMLSGLIKSQQ